MATLNSLLPDVLGRIEETNPPVFWDLAGEVYPQLVYGLFESALISGVVQVNSLVIDLQPNQTYFSLSGWSAYGVGGYGEGNYGGYLVPKGLIAPIRMRAGYAIRKTTLKGLDDMVPNWQAAAPGEQILSWFPLGVSMFGIYPQLTVEAQVTMDFLSCPVNVSRPYTGNETIPFQAEFFPLLTKYAAAMLRAKEGGGEAEEADTTFQQYMDGVKSLSLFQQRVDSLVYTKAFGGRAGVNSRTAV